MLVGVEVGVGGTAVSAGVGLTTLVGVAVGTAGVALAISVGAAVGVAVAARAVASPGLSGAGRRMSLRPAERTTAGNWITTLGVSWAEAGDDRRTDEGAAIVTIEPWGVAPPPG